MSAILKAEEIISQPIAPAVFHMRDLMHEAQCLIAAGRETASKIVENAHQQAIQIKEQARQRGYAQGLQEGRQEGQRRGHEQALAEARSKFDSDLKHLAQQLAGLLHELTDQRDRCLREAQRDLLDFAVQLARHVTKSIGAVNRDVAPANLRAALSLVMARSDLLVRAHPEDLAALHRFAAQLMAQDHNAPRLRFVEDDAIERGGVRVCSEAGGIDATLERQLQQIAAALVPASEEQDCDV